MSRIGKKVIEIPQGTEVKMDNGTFTVKGPKGSLVREFHPDIAIKIEGNTVTLAMARKDIPNKALWGTYGSHIVNMIEGVNTGFTRKLILEGIGFKSEVKGTDLALALGFSHPVKVAIPADLKVTADKNVITVTGPNKDQVGQFTANVRALKKPEPYKGKGFRYDDEKIRRKQGKKAA